MKGFLSITVLMVLVAVSTQLQCFVGKSTQNGNSVTENVTPEACPRDASFCMKIYQEYYNSQVNTYSCGTSTCARAGCFENKQGYGTCCCRGNYCNSGFDFSKTAVSSMVLTVASVYYMSF
ncbi:unnamed protein product [Caenorhabditis brenneri]